MVEPHPKVRATAHAVGANECERVAVCLLPGFSLLDYAGLIEPLRIANGLAGRSLYTWHPLSAHATAVRSSCGLPVETTAVNAIDEWPDIIVLCAARQRDAAAEAAIVSWLNRAVRYGGCHVGAVSSAVLILARSGLLTDYRCSVYWSYFDSCIEHFPGIEMTRHLFQIDRDRFTCAGGSACMDLMLEKIQRKHGRDLCRRVRQSLLHDDIRKYKQIQRFPVLDEPLRAPPPLQRMLRLMEDNIETPLCADEIAATVGCSKRQIQRLCRKHFDKTMLQVYLIMRLDRAYGLVNQTNLSVTEIGFACGFQTPSNFCRSYRKYFGTTPSADRHAVRLEPGSRVDNAKRTAQRPRA